MTLHKEGFGTLFTAAIVLFLISSCSFYIAPICLFSTIVVASVILFGFLMWFFRKPIRKIENNDAVIYAPCDGKVVVIEDTEEKEFYGSKRKQVSIFMSPLNVHINWYPVAGTISYYKYHPGEKLVAWHPKSSELNERTSVVIETPTKKSVLIRQVAGALARRIVCYAQENTVVEQGQEVGFIKFGSRMDLYLPLDAKIEVEIGQKVSGNKTILARW